MRQRVSDVLKWCQQETRHPSRNWQGLCQSFSRTAWQLPAFGRSAKIAFHAIPAAHRHRSKPEAVPAGAICYDDQLGRYGHAWISAGHGLGYSTDYLRRGHIDLVPLGLPHWRGNRVGFVDWVDATPYGRLPLR